jgi:isoleucyl-tRNA synthetase
MRWNGIRDIRRVVTGALEPKRADKVIGSSLEASPIIILDNQVEAEVLNGIPFDEVAITSGFAVDAVADTGPDVFTLPDVPRVAVRFRKASGDKCARCWRVLEETRADTHLCNRCTDAVGALEPA